MPEPTATNPQTGEKVVFRNGKWVPAGGGNTPASPAQPRAPMVGPGPDPHKQAAEERANRAEARAERTEARVASAAADAARRAEAQNIPNAAATGIQENISGLSKLDEALRLLDARPGSIGPGTGLFSDTFTQFNDPEGTDVRRALAEIGAIKIHDLSGAAVSASEAPRFMPFVPKVTDRPGVARKKLEGFKKEMAKVLEEADSYYSEANRFLPYSTPGMEALRQTNFGQGPNQEGLTPPPFGLEGNVQAPPPLGLGLAGGLRNADGQVAGNVHDSGDTPRWRLAEDRIRQEDDPILAGIRDEYERRLEKGESGDQLVAWARSVGINPTASESIRAQAQFRKENPDIPIGEYDTSQLDDRFITLSDNEIGADEIGASEAHFMNTADAISGFNMDSIAGATGGNAERTRIGMGQVRREHPTASTVGTLSGVAINALAAEAGLARLGVASGVARTMGANALAGAHEGFGGTDYNSQGGPASFGDRLKGAGKQAGFNALAAAGTTGAIKALRATAAPVARGVARSVGADKNVAIRQVGRSLQEDGLTPRTAAARVAAGHSRGSPMSLSDVGENTRELAASMGRHRGESRSVVRTVAGNRQEQQMERISAAVSRDLGPTANIRELGDELMLRAKDEAGPLYREAFEAPGAGAVEPKLKGLLGRPSTKRAMVRARRIAEEEGRDPTSLGFDLNAQGEVILTRAPSWETLHYIKTGLDDVIEGYRDKVTGRLVLDAEGRLINATKNALLGVMDGANPAYKAARAAYAGQASMRDALELGAGALSRSPDDVAANIKTLGPAEMEMYRLGLRKSIVDLIGKKGDYADKVNALIGTPKARAVLKKVLGGEANYDRFIATLQDERAMGLTYKAVHGNSATAGRMAFDETTSGENIAKHVFDVSSAAKTGGLVGATVRTGEKIAEAGRFGAGAAGDRARTDVARLLSESDPDMIVEIAKQANRAVAKQRLGKRVGSRRAAGAGTVGGTISAALGQETSPDQ